MTRRDELLARCRTFVDEQSCGEWDDKAIRDDAAKLVEFVLTEIRLSAQQREPARVKELEWDGNRARSIVGAYSIHRADGEWAVLREHHQNAWKCIASGKTPTFYDAFDAAKSAAQADYEQRIMAAIEIQSSDGCVESGHTTSSGSGPLPSASSMGEACSALEPPEVSEAVARQQEQKRAAGVAPDPSEPVEQDEAERCISCGLVLRDGDNVYNDASGGVIHAACCGPERENYTHSDGTPLKDDEPIPAPRRWSSDTPPSPVPAPAGIGMDWDVSDETHERIAEIDRALRDGAINAPNIVAGSTAPAGEVVEMAAVGRSTMAAIETITSHDGPYKDWIPAEDPAEIITDLYESLLSETERLREALEIAHGHLCKIADTNCWTHNNLQGWQESPGGLREYAEMATKEIDAALNGGRDDE